MSNHNSDDLTGQDAFDRVLETAMGAHLTARQATEVAASCREAMRQSQLRVDQLNADIQALRAEAQKAEPALETLWLAASKVSNFIKASNGSHTLTRDSDLEKALDAALFAAGEFCGQPPF